MARVHVVRLRDEYVATDEDTGRRGPRLVRGFPSAAAAQAWVREVEAGRAAPPPAINPFDAWRGLGYRVCNFVPRPGAPRPPHASREWPARQLFWGRLSQLSSLGEAGLLELLDELGVPRPPTATEPARVAWNAWWAQHVATAPAETRAAIWSALDQAVFFEIVPVELET